MNTEEMNLETTEVVKDNHDIPSLEEVEKELNRERGRNRRGKVLKRIVIALIVVAAFAVIMAMAVTPVLQISGNSMTETLHDGEIVTALKSGKFEKGDVIAFYYNNSILIKRVIATAGEWVNIDEDGTVYVNNVPIDEPYISEKALGECTIDLPYQVPDNKIFVMGDHRATSIDSRNTAVGAVNKDDVLGKVFFRVWPLSNFGGLK